MAHHPMGKKKGKKKGGKKTMPRPAGKNTPKKKMK